MYTCGPGVDQYYTPFSCDSVNSMGIFHSVDPSSSSSHLTLSTIELVRVSLLCNTAVE